MNLQVIKNRIKKALAYTVTAILFLIISAFLFLQMPPVQKRLISYYLKDFSSITGFPTTINSFKMLWFDRLELGGVTVYDPAGNKMIRAGEIMINFRILQLFEQKDINIDGIYLDSAHVFLTKIGENDSSRDLNLNVLITRINENFSSSSSGGRSPRINIGEAFINRSQFTLINQDQPPIENGFNYNQFSLSIDEGQLKSFVIIGDTTQFNVRTLIAEDLNTHFKVKHLSTFFRMSNEALELTGLNLIAGESIINDTIIFKYEHQRDLNDFVEKVRFHAHFENTILNPNDLALFAPGVEQLGKPIALRGTLNGKVNKFKLKDMDIRLGKTIMLGSLDMDGLPEMNETFIVLNIKDSQLDPYDLSFLFNDNVMDRFAPMGTLKIDGQFLGYPTDFVANGTLVGKLGLIKSDINFKVNEKDFNRSEYSGKLMMSKFDIGTYLQDTAMFGKVTLDGKIAGSGLTLQTADFKLNGKVNSIGINKYNYVNITTDARFAQGLFSGFVNINDPNLEFTARGSIDLRENRNQFKVQAKLDTAMLHKINLSKDTLFLQATFTADISGLSLDSLAGQIDFSELFVVYKSESVKFDHIFIKAEKDHQQRSLQIQSNLIDAEVKGNYLFSNLLEDIQILENEIELNIRNDQREIRTYYQNKNYHPQTYQANVNILIKDIEPLAELLAVDLKMSKNTRLEGRFTSGYTTIFNAYSNIDSLVYNGNTFINTQVELTASKIADSTAVLGLATITSDNQIIKKSLRTKNLLAEGIWNRNHIEFGLDADQEGETNYIRLKGVVDFLPDSTLISMAPSMVNLLEREWHFADRNFISVKEGEWSFNKLKLVTGPQSIEINGMLSQNPSKLITLNIHALNMAIFNVLTDKKFDGIMDAEIAMSDYFKKPNIQNSVNIKNLTVNDFLIGDLSGTNHWDTTQRKFLIGLAIDRELIRTVDLNGEYNPNEKTSPLNISARLQKAHLKIVEPFLDDIFSNISGTISGDFKVTGVLDAPRINGEGLVDEGQVMISYLKTVYRFVGRIGLTPSSLYFKGIELTDALRNNAQLEGEITHRDFNNMEVNINAKFGNFQVLNTSSKDNNLFYGQAYASGNVKFTGPISNLKITSTARTEKNTRIFIPIDGASSVEKKDFINFVNFRDTLVSNAPANKDGNKVALTGLTLNLNLDVTPDAYCEIIFDLKSGDIIRGRGNGDLKLEIDTRGEFNMFGPFEFTQGWYNFTLYDIINKEFEIQKGSRITWYGDPYQGILNINASYNQLASLAPLIQDPTISNTPQLRRKYPVQVLLKLEEFMLSPKITFDIIAKDLPKNIQLADLGTVNLDIEFAAFKNKLDEQELTRQVFSLIVLRRFSPPESFNTSGSVVNSVSELLSNQLSYWMSQVDQNLEIDVDLNVMDTEAFNTFQLRFSYTFFNGRLRVTGDGTFNNANSAVNTSNQPNPSSVAGDWTVDYMLTADGKLRVKMYSRSNVNPVLSSVNNQNAFTTGTSLIHTQSFDEIRELWSSNRKKKKKDEGLNTLLNRDAIKEEDVTE